MVSVVVTTDMTASVVAGADLLGVVGEPREQRAGGVAVEVADRKLQDAAGRLRRAGG